MTNPTIKATGLSYVGDAGNVSRYRLQIDGIPLFDVLADNGVTLDPTEAGVEVPADATLHPLAVQTTDGKVTLPTKGFGLKHAHIDAEGVSPAHIDGITVAQYILPRAMFFAAKLLQARQEV